jgi:hypothetical protein
MKGQFAIVDLDGKRVIQRGSRLFAIPKQLGTADRIHAMNGAHVGTWDVQMRIPDPRIRNTRSIRNSRG